MPVCRCAQGPGLARGAGGVPCGGTGRHGVGVKPPDANKAQAGNSVETSIQIIALRWRASRGQRTAH
jgi:hypothetical protein